MKSILILFILTTTQQINAETIYQWQDKQGNTNFSQIPDAKIEAKEIIIEKSKIDSAAAIAQLKKQIDNFATRRDESILRETEGAEAVEYKKKLDSYCSALKSNLETMKNSKTVMAQDTKKVMTGAEKKLEQEKTTQQYNKRCN